MTAPTGADRAHAAHARRQLETALDRLVTRRTAMDGDTRPLAVDADGYVWRINDDGSHSMARTNPDNSPTPKPLTIYAPVTAVPTPPPADVDALCDWLDKLRAEATPGPWVYDPAESDIVWDGTERWPSILAVTRYPRETHAADAALIVAAVNALPALAAEVRRLRTIEDAVTGLVSEFADEAEEYVGMVERLPTPTERTAAAARAISFGGAADRLRAALSAQATGGGQ